MNTRYKANIALFLSVCGLALSFSYAENGFGGGLIYHAFLAAVIGGLADWFAVTAIFRKPFGISWRTDILRRNRPRIMKELIDFTGRDILSTANIMAVWREKNLAELFAKYLFQQGGKERILCTADALIHRLAADIDTGKIAGETAPLVKNFVRSLRLEQNATKLVKGLAFDENVDWLATECSKLGREILMSAEFQQILCDNIAAWRMQYVGTSTGRAFMFQAINLTDEKILGIVTGKLEDKLTELADNHTTAGQKIRCWLKQGIDNLTSAETWKNFLTVKIDSQIDMSDIDTSIDNWLKKRLFDVNGERPVWQSALLAVLAAKIDEFTVKETWQNKFDTWVKAWLEEQLTINHQLLIDMIASRLTEFSDDELINLIEDKVAADLQIIRINGALIGSLAGMVLYTLTFFLMEVSGL